MRKIMKVSVRILARNKDMIKQESKYFWCRCCIKILEFSYLKLIFLRFRSASHFIKMQKNTGKQQQFLRLIKIVNQEKGQKGFPVKSKPIPFTWTSEL